MGFKNCGRAGGAQGRHMGCLTKLAAATEGGKNTKKKGDIRS